MQSEGYTIPCLHILPIHGKGSTIKLQILAEWSNGVVHILSSSEMITTSIDIAESIAYRLSVFKCDLAIKAFTSIFIFRMQNI